MATNHTTNYALNLWEPTDAFLREEFNENTQKIEAALDTKGNCRIVYGSYVGTGRYGGTESSATVLQLGFQPKLVIVKEMHSGSAVFIKGAAHATHLYSTGSDGTSFNVTWLEDGLKWWLANPYNQGASGQLNSERETYYYVAFS